MCVISSEPRERNSYSHFADGKGTEDLSDASLCQAFAFSYDLPW